MPTKAYPRRTDEVFWERFNGTLESAQNIANLAKANVYMYVAPNPRFYPDDTASLERIEVGSRSVGRGDYVVVAYDGGEPSGQIEILTDDEFGKRYSKDGN